MTLAYYISLRFLRSFIIAVLAASALIVMGDVIELLRKSSSVSNGDLPILSMAMLHLPSVLSKALPFVTMIASLTTFLGLARSSELVVTRAVGLSAWKVVAPPVFVAIGLGIIGFTAFNPLAASTLRQYERLEIKYFKGQDSLLSVSKEGLWLRQNEPEGQTVIRADRSTGDGLVLTGVTVFGFDENGQLERRIETDIARLRPNHWELVDARLWKIERSSEDGSVFLQPKTMDILRIPTDLTSNRILESFALPNTISFWDIPDFVDTLEASGFSATAHHLYLQTELSKPLLFAAMVLIGAGFSMRHVRFGGAGTMVLTAVLSGFALFFLSDMTQALGSSGSIPVLIAAWVPPTAAALLAMTLLLHLEDG